MDGFDYNEFLEQMKAAVGKRAGEDSSVSISSVAKNNRQYADSMCILPRGANFSPAIYMEDYYKQYQKGVGIDELAGSIVSEYSAHFCCEAVDFSFFTDFEKARGTIVCKLINYEKNKAVLDRVPHRKFHDLAVVYYCRMDHELFGKGSIMVENRHLQMWGITEDEIDGIARRNTVRLLPYQLYDMETLLKETFGLDTEWQMKQELPMYVLTNTEKYLGAVNMIFDSILEAVAERLEDDYFVLPSSIHECIIIPALQDIEESQLHTMVEEINRECVADEEILGDTIYRYERAKKTLYTAWAGDKKT